MNTICPAQYGQSVFPFSFAVLSKLTRVLVITLESLSIEPLVFLHPWASTGTFRCHIRVQLEPFGAQVTLVSELELHPD